MQLIACECNTTGYRQIRYWGTVPDNTRCVKINVTEEEFNKILLMTIVEIETLISDILEYRKT